MAPATNAATLLSATVLRAPEVLAGRVPLPVELPVPSSDVLSRPLLLSSEPVPSNEVLSSELPLSPPASEVVLSAVAVPLMVREVVFEAAREPAVEPEGEAVAFALAPGAVLGPSGALFPSSVTGTHV